MRKRAFAILARVPVEKFAPKPAPRVGWADIITPNLSGDWTGTSHAPKIRNALERAGVDMAAYNYYSPPTVSTPSQPAKTITTVARTVIAHVDGRRYWLKSHDYARLMGLPDHFLLTGPERDRCKGGNGVSYPVARQIADYLVRTSG